MLLFSFHLFIDEIIGVSIYKFFFNPVLLTESILWKFDYLPHFSRNKLNKLKIH